VGKSEVMGPFIPAVPKGTYLRRILLGDNSEEWKVDTDICHKTRTIA